MPAGRYRFLKESGQPKMGFSAAVFAGQNSAGVRAPEPAGQKGLLDPEGSAAATAVTARRGTLPFHASYGSLTLRISDVVHSGRNARTAEPPEEVVEVCGDGIYIRPDWLGPTGMNCPRIVEAAARGTLFAAGWQEVTGLIVTFHNCRREYCRRTSGIFPWQSPSKNAAQNCWRCGRNFRGVDATGRPS